MKKFWTTIKSRWRNAMPKFFSRVCWTCSLISGSALAANEAMQVAGIQPHQWWIDIAPYLIGVPAGMAFAAKFSQQYTGEPIVNNTKKNANEPAGGYVNNCDVVAESPQNEPADIEPYNES